MTGFINSSKTRRLTSRSTIPNRLISITIWVWLLLSVVSYIFSYWFIQYISCTICSFWSSFIIYNYNLFCYTIIAVFIVIIIRCNKNCITFTVFCFNLLFSIEVRSPILQEIPSLLYLP